MLVICYLSRLEREGERTFLDTATREWFRAGDLLLRIT